MRKPLAQVPLHIFMELLTWKFHAGSPGLTSHSLRFVLGALVLPLFCKNVQMGQIKGNLHQSMRHKSIDNSLASLHQQPRFTPPICSPAYLTLGCPTPSRLCFSLSFGYYQNHQFQWWAPPLSLILGNMQRLRSNGEAWMPLSPPIPLLFSALSLCPWLFFAFSNQMPNPSERKPPLQT